MFIICKVNNLLKKSYIDLENKYDTSEEIKNFVEKFYYKSLNNKSFKILRDEIIKAL